MSQVDQSWQSNMPRAVGRTVMDDWSMVHCSEGARNKQKTAARTTCFWAWPLLQVIRCWNHPAGLRPFWSPAVCFTLPAQPVPLWFSWRPPVTHTVSSSRYSTWVSTAFYGMFLVNCVLPVCYNYLHPSTAVKIPNPENISFIQKDLLSNANLPVYPAVHPHDATIARSHLNMTPSICQNSLLSISLTGCRAIK